MDYVLLKTRNTIKLLPYYYQPVGQSLKHEAISCEPGCYLPSNGLVILIVF